METPRPTSALGCCVAVGMLGVTAPSPSSSWRSLREAETAVDPTGPLVAAVSLGAWALVLWLGLTVLLTLTARAPGAGGRLAAVLAGRIAPAAVRRAVDAALGLGLAAGALGAAPAAAATTAPVAAPAVVASARIPSPVPSTAQLDLDWGGGTGSAASSPSTSAASSPSTPPARAPVAEGRGTAVVVVQPGDTLWGLAEQGLRRTGVPAPTDAQVAQAWPSWWSANRDVIGDDPDLILPGTSLQAPS